MKMAGFVANFRLESFRLLLNPVFLRWVSVFFHLLWSFSLFVSWVRNKRKARNPHHTHAKPARILYYRAVLLTSIVVALYDFVLFSLDYFNWYEIGWTEGKLVNMVDLLVRGFVCLSSFIYLYTQFPDSGGSNKFPVLFRVWWGCYLTISAYCLIIDLVVSRKKNASLPAQILVSDSIYVVWGTMLCYAGLFGKKLEETAGLEQPLLNRNGGGSPKSVENSLSPYENANFLSKITFFWMGSVISKGYRKTLDSEDVPQLPGGDSVNRSYPIFKRFLESNATDRRSSSSSNISTLKLVKSLISIAWVDIVITGLLALLYALASYVGPYLIDVFVQYLYEGRREFKGYGYALVSVFFFAKLVECFAQRHWFFRLQRAGIKSRSVLVAMMYSKCLTLSGHSKQGYTSGEIINFMSVDADRVGDFAWYMHDPWMVIVQVSLALLILYKNLGLASIAALTATVGLMLANYPLSTKLEKFQDNLMQSKDKRMKATSEILKNMRILKLQAWEMKFLSKISQFREKEAGWLKKYLYTNAVTTFVFWSTPTFVSVVTFVTCMIMGISLESGKILSALATFRILQEPIYNLPDTISMIIQTKVSLDRLALFLSLDDMQSDAVEKIPTGTSKNAIEIIDGNFTWDKDPSSSSVFLRDINLSVSHGKKVAICGTVGSGKSSLLSCLLGEMPKIGGTLRVSGSTAYVAQSAWIQSGKIVDNILFGKEMDSERYEKVLDACSLKKDLEILPFGDQTVIGERGINLSGGQKQRVQIARAVYHDADLYLFDDPFSAVDAHTGSHLFKECLLGLLSSKTVIYVTHQVEFLPPADLILVMKDGKITQAGKYNDILASGSDFMELVGAHEKALSVMSFNDTITISSSSGSFSMITTTNVESDDLRDDAKKLMGHSKSEVKEAQQLVQEEEREKGKVGFLVYWKYITTAYGGALVPAILLLSVFFQVFQIGSNYWMAWATPISSSDVKDNNISGLTLITVYSALAAGSALCILGRTTLLATACYKTATILFNKMHFCLFRAPMSFFDATPSGRILNRASTDQADVDLKVSYRAASTAFIMIQLFGVIAVMSQVAWQVSIIFIPVIVASVWYQKYYLPCARELTRLVGVTKAPIIQHFTESISGGTTIRSFNQQSRFWDTGMKLIDGYSRPKFYVAGAMEWLCFRLDFLSSVTFACCLIFLISLPVGFVDPAIAGLAVTYGLNINILQTILIWNLCDLENRIISVERVLQYTNIHSEPPLIVENNRPASCWPSTGEVEISDLKVRYALHMPLVLRGITCKFEGGKKSGIVGRTGSGKSTLIQALFRIVEPANGTIIIDGMDISMIGLHDLRSRISIIPQEPTMFEGTVRSNLDPLEEYTDSQIWEALNKCQIGDEVRSKEGKLDSIVSENGENWSMGQRQLVCLGRVLLKRSKILVLDEATASVDTATDNLIQQTLRLHFSDSTLLIIAHRITSVLDSDMVLVLSRGLVDECDSPSLLLEDKSSSFSKLVAEYQHHPQDFH